MRRSVSFLALAAFSMLLVACNGDDAPAGAAAAPASSGANAAAPPAPAPAPPMPMTASAPTVTRTVLLGGLQNPWDMAFTADGSMLYTERSRGLSVRRPNGTTALLYRPADLVVQGQSGMLGLALDPQFDTNRTIYLFIASNANGATDNRVIRLVLDAGFTTVGSRVDILTGITYDAGNHSGGRIRFGPDGQLYVGSGDTRQGPVPQNRAVLGGKVLRVDRDGNAAPGNLGGAGTDPRIYTFGHRNVQGIAFRPGTGQPYISEHGPNFQDEVTPLAPGNAGWDPRCSNGTGYCGYDNITRMTDLVKFPDALRPAWSSGDAVGSSRGTAGNAFIVGAQWGAWDGALVIGQLSGTRLLLLTLAGDGRSVVNQAPLFAGDGVRLRAVVLGRDGALYVSTDGKAGGDEIWRVVPN